MRSARELSLRPEVLWRRAVSVGLLLVCGKLLAQDPSTDLVIGAAGPAAVTAGSNVTYTITVSGPTTATGVTIWDVLPAGTTYVSGSVGATACAAPNQPATVGLPGATVTCSVGALSSGSATATIVVASTAAGTLKNVVGVIGDQYDANMSNNSAVVTTTVNPAGTITVAPNAGFAGGGQAVTITGTSTFFTGATSVLFGTVAATYTVRDDTHIAATTPFQPIVTGPVDVTIATPAGTYVGKNAYSYYRIPNIVTIAPANGPVGGGQVVTITGQNFLGTTSVTFGGVAAQFSVQTDTQMTATTPPHATAIVDVSATNPGGTGTKTGAYTYGTPPPVITTVTPAIGPIAGGRSVTITGTSFLGATSVTFGGTAASFTVSGSTSIAATTPAHAAGPATVAVTTPGGTGSLANAYQYLNPPVVSSVSPSSGPMAGGTAVTVNGSGFISGSTTVTFGGTALTGLAYPSSVQITGVTPAHAAGAVSIVVANPDGETATLANGFTFVPPPYEGFLDQADCTAIAGWAWDPSRPNTPINVNIYDGAALIATVSANLFRQDLLNAGKGNGYHAFNIPTPQSLKTGTTHTVTAKYTDTLVALGATPKYVNCPAPTVSIAWIQPSSVTFGPPNTLTVAGYAQNGTGTVQLQWQDITVTGGLGGWTTVAFQATPDSTGVWYNTIPVSDYCHWVSAQATYTGVTGSYQYTTANAISHGWCTESAKVVWIQPQTTAGFGPPGSLIVAGNAQNAPSGTGVYLYWRDVTAGGVWNLVSYAPPPDSSHTWYNSFPANFSHIYSVYIVYDAINTSAGPCTYAGNSTINWCP